MLALIKKYGFASASDGDEKTFTEELQNLPVNAEQIPAKELGSIYLAFKEKICIKGFAARMSPGYWMADRLLQKLLDIR